MPMVPMKSLTGIPFSTCTFLKSSSAIGGLSDGACARMATARKTKATMISETVEPLDPALMAASLADLTAVRLNERFGAAARSLVLSALSFAPEGALIRKLIVATAFICLALASSVRAHHGDADRYNQEVITVTGTVVDVQMVNPHARIVFD